MNGTDSHGREEACGEFSACGSLSVLLLRRRLLAGRQAKQLSLPVQFGLSSLPLLLWSSSHTHVRTHIHMHTQVHIHTHGNIQGVRVLSALSLMPTSVLDTEQRLRNSQENKESALNCYLSDMMTFINAALEEMATLGNNSTPLSNQFRLTRSDRAL